MSRFWSLVSLVVVGIIIADLVTHPTGTKAAFSGVTDLESNAGNQLLGGSNTGGK
jgi:hypothetical protein